MTSCGTTTGYRKGCRCPDCRGAASVASARRKAARGNVEPPEHGKINGYNDYGCRCSECKAAYKAFFQEYRARKAATGVPAHIPHGSASAYSTYKCRCGTCREGARLRDTAHFEATKEQHRANDRRRGQTPRRRATQAARRRQREMSAGATAYAELLLSGPCSYCGGRSTSVDHIIPIAAGGGSECDNLTGACGSCNSSKRDQSLLAFMLRRSRDLTELPGRTA